MAKFINKFHNSNKCLKIKNELTNYQYLDNIFLLSRKDPKLHKLINYFISNGPNDSNLRMSAHKIM